MRVTGSIASANPGACLTSQVATPIRGRRAVKALPRLEGRGSIALDSVSIAVYKAAMIAADHAGR
jgi:hypothetical protein